MYIPQEYIRLRTSRTSEEFRTFSPVVGQIPPIGQGGTHHIQGLTIYLQATRLEIQVQAVVKVQVFREAVVLLEKILKYIMLYTPMSVVI